MEFFAIAFIIAIIVVVLWYIMTFNSIKTLKLKVSEALSGIDVALTKRYDVLTKMVQVTKQYKDYEAEVLENIINLRSGMTMQERSEACEAMDELSGRINIIAEQYPQLRSADVFVELQKSILDTEEHLQAARRLYNSNVTLYNTKLVTFPSSIVASNMNALPTELFEAQEHKRQDVSMDL